uniref:Uncharacterized protein n=1 Tax=Graphocephala atropunctata TaxID=36148 RepID=A0A1B6LNK1_9HEMI
MSRKENISFDQSCTSSSQGCSVQPHEAQSGASDRFKHPSGSSSLISSDKCAYDSRLSDSGVWSGSNIHSEEINSPESPVSKSSDFMYSSEKVLDDNKSYMRLDSGIDVTSVSQNLSELSVKDAEIYNDLNDPSSKSKESTVNINEQFANGQKALEIPVHMPSLLEKCFEQNEDGDTELHLAIIHKFIETVYALVRMIPNSKYLNIKNDDRQTPLHLAVLTRQPRLVRLLVCAGASPEELDRRGNSALHLAVQSDDLSSVRAIIDPITIPETIGAQLQYTPFHVHREIAITNIHNYEGQTCVHLAALNSNVDILRHLLWFGADINAKEWKGGQTCLHLAVDRADARLCMFLLGETAIDADETNYAGYTAYQAAWDSNGDIARALRDHGVDTYIASDSDSDDDVS